MNKYLKFTGIEAKQSNKHHVISVICKANEILQIAEIDRIRRNETGEVFGFQRPKIKNHINEIRDYLKKDEAVLPNPIVLAFTKGISIENKDRNNIEIEIDVTTGPPGLVVDGQQRLTALAELKDKEFEVFVSILICEDEEELKRQFILINNTKPLSKSLIFELLPGVSNLPERMSAKTLASELINNLNYDESSSLYLDIKQHTNVQGRIRDTAIQRLILNSLSDGACRELINEENGKELCFNLISQYFKAIQGTFPKAWDKKLRPHTSRLIHGAGIVAMGYVMEYLFNRDNARTFQEFKAGIAPLEKRTAWTEKDGSWNFGDEIRNWNSIQNTGRDIQLLASYLLRIVRKK
jgi:DGQHR domain-containing protein